jgi:ABC-type transporter Mla subunit MlaD
VVLDVGVGLGVLLCGIGVLLLCSSAARFVARLNGTLDEVDQQIAALSTPVVRTLDHVGGIADTADATIARLGAVVGTLESVAASLGKTAQLASNALAPALVNAGAALTGISAGLRKLVTGRRADVGGPPSESTNG